MMDLKESIYSRVSVRNFTSTDLKDSDLKKIIQAGIQAPSACNIQGWRFIVIKSEKTRQALIDAGATKLISNAPVGILVLYNNMTDNLEYKDHIQSASACIENMLLMANGIGVGSCWICNLPDKNKLRRILKVPSHYDPMAYIMLGYTKNKPKKKVRKQKYSELVSIDIFSKEKKVSLLNKASLNLKRIARNVYHKIPFKGLIKPLVDKIFEKKF